MPELTLCGFKIKTTEEDHNLLGSDEALMEKYWRPRSGDLCIDAGFGPGTWTLLALARGAHTLSFDPKKEANEILHRQIDLNGYSRAEVVRAGLWDHNGMAKFGVNSFHDAQLRDWAPVTRLDDHLWKIGLLDIREPMKVLMNMDVEGAELEVLRGAIVTIRQYKPRLIIEVHKKPSAGEIMEAISRISHGYSFTRENGFLIADHA